jgi:predicted nucleotide-binding protein
MGKISKKNVCALVKSEVKTPEDIGGVVYTKLDQWSLETNSKARAES